MAKKSRELAPSPAVDKDGNEIKVWQAPTSDQEFTFESMDEAPAWVDRKWAGFDHGPALQLPAGELSGGPGPYHTKTANVGDIVKFITNKGSTPAHFEVIKGEIDPLAAGATTKRPPQQTNASLEDMIKLGWVAQADLDQAALSQVTLRSPDIKPYLAAPDGTGASIPTPVATGTYVKGST